MSITRAVQAIKQDIQRKLNCNSVQTKHNDYDDYGDYSETHSGHYHMDLSEGECHGDYGDAHGDYYDCDCGTAQPEARSAAKTDSGQECKYDDYGDYGDVHGDYYDFDFQEEKVAVRPEQSVKSPMPNILERVKNRLSQNTK